MAGSIYRLRRKLRYEEEIWRPATQVVLVNSEGPEDIEQRHALIQLMNWTKDKCDQMAAVDTENSDNPRQSAVLSVFSLDTDVTNNPPLDTGEYRKGGNSKKGTYNKDANRDDEIELSTFKTQINQPEKVTVSHNRKHSLELLQDASGLPVVDIDGDLLANRHMLSFLSPSFVERGKITNGREAVYTADYRVRHNDRKFSAACPQIPEVSNRDARQIEVKSGKTTSKKKKTLNVKAVTTDSIV